MVHFLLKNFQLYFSIVQHYKDLELMHQISYFLYNLPSHLRNLNSAGDQTEPRVLPNDKIRITKSQGTNNLVAYLVIDHYDLIK